MWPFDELGTEIAQLVNLPWAMIALLINLVMVCFYPVVVIIATIETLFGTLWTPVAEFINVLIGIPNLLIDLLNSLFIGTLPPIWIGLIMAELFIVLGLRIYSFLKDIEILGNKI